MFIQVVAQNPHGTGRNRARRRFANGAVHRFEVFDRTEDFFDDAERTRPSMEKINAAGYLAIKADPIFSVLVEGIGDESIASEKVAAARAQATELAGKLAATEMDLSSVRLELVAATKRIANLEAKLAEASAPPAPPPTETPTAPTEPGNGVEGKVCRRRRHRLGTRPKLNGRCQPEKNDDNGGNRDRRHRLIF